MVTKKEYNGWNNYETWLMALWISNDQCMESEATDMAEESRHARQEIYELADTLKNWIEEFPEVSEVSEKSGFVSDLLNAAMSEIDWYEIAENYLNGLDPEEPEEKEEE
jgi:hypothetical protein